LAVIAFPELVESSFRRSWRGRAQGDSNPAPATVMRVVGCLLLITLVAAHHFLALGGVKWR
jgi:hypothetical protein